MVRRPKASGPAASGSSAQDLSQDERVARLTTPLGPDTLAITRFNGDEAISELFTYELEAIGDTTLIDFDAIIGQHCTVEVKSTSGAQRFFDGILVEAEWIGLKGPFYAYRLTLRPWLWLLSRTSDCRIFKNESTPEIIEKIFTEAGFSDFEKRLNEDHPTHEYCVQYRETDLDFVLRLMEEEGIAYFFEHAQDRHTLVLADAQNSLTPVPDCGTLRYGGHVSDVDISEERLFELSMRRRLRTGKVTLNDYDYAKPNASLIAEKQAASSYEHGRMERYDYPGRYDERTEGDQYARVRLEAEQAEHDRRVAVGDAVSLYPGGLFTLKEHAEASQNIEYLVVRALHGFSEQSYRSVDMGSPEPYQGTYELQPSERPYRPPVLTPKPRIHGCQTAKVVGKEGEEIDVDEEARILVQFHWDREKRSSRRVRIAQPWAGDGWGSVFIPRIGMEVVVEYVNGDPDRPLVVGAVYNGENKVEFDLPENKTRAYIRSKATKNGDPVNLIGIEDKKGEEVLRFEAQRRESVLVHDHRFEEIGRSFTRNDTSDYADASWGVQVPHGDVKLDVEDGHRQTTVSKNDELEVGQDKTTEVGGDYTNEVARNYELQAGMNIDIEAGIKITLKVGGNSITLSPAGIDIKAAGMLTLNGAIVKIN